MVSYPVRQITRALQPILKSHPDGRKTQVLSGRHRELAALVYDAITEAIPAFSASRHPDTLKSLAREVDEHIEEIARLLGGGVVRELSFVTGHAVQRANQRFPLEPVLHAYRVAQKVIVPWLHDADQIFSASVFW